MFEERYVKYMKPFKGLNSVTYKDIIKLQPTEEKTVVKNKEYIVKMIESLVD